MSRRLTSAINPKWGKPPATGPIVAIPCPAKFHAALAAIAATTATSAPGTLGTKCRSSKTNASTETDKTTVGKLARGNPRTTS